MTSTAWSSMMEVDDNGLTSSPPPCTSTRGPPRQSMVPIPVQPPRVLSSIPPPPPAAVQPGPSKAPASPGPADRPKASKAPAHKAAPPMFHAFFELRPEAPNARMTLTLDAMKYQVTVLFYPNGDPKQRRQVTDGHTWLFGTNGGFPYIQLHGCPQAVMFGSSQIVKFIASTPPTRSLLKKNPNFGGATEVGNERDALEPNGHVSWGNRMLANHTCNILRRWLNDPQRWVEQHPVTHDVPSLDNFPRREFHPWQPEHGKPWHVKHPDWKRADIEWRNRHHEWTTEGVPMVLFRDHVLCSFILMMLSGAAPPCWETGWKLRPQNLAEHWRLNFNTMMVVARCFDGHGGVGRTD